MVLLFVNQATHKERQQGVKQNQRMERQGRHCAVNHHEAHVFNHAIHGVAHEKILHPHGIAVNRVEYCRHVHQKQSEKIIKVRDVPEKDVQRRENKANADVEKNQAEYRIYKRKKAPGKVYAVQRRKEEKYHQRDCKVDNRGDVFRQQKYVLWHVDFGKNMSI